MPNDIRPENLSATDSLDRLQDGNERFVAIQTTSSSSAPPKRADFSNDQTPFAIVVTHTDDRVNPERIFDENQGSLVVIGVVDESNNSILSRVEQAVLRLGINLVIVLGHDIWEAVGTVDIHCPTTGHHLESPPPVPRSDVQIATDHSLPLSIEVKVRLIATEIRESTPVMKLLEAEGVVVRPACYSLKTSEVHLL